jgi:hypothetical protein
LADTYTISTGSGRVEISGVTPQKGLYAIQVVSNASLDANITLNLQQSIDGTNWHDLPETPIVHTSGVSSTILQTDSFHTNRLAVYVNVGSATLGTLTIFNPDVD